MFQRRHILFAAALLSLATTALCAQSGRGRPIIRHFSPDVYGAAGDNWCMVQDARGFLYVANGSGVLEFDGSHWRLIPVANRSVARWLVIDDSGTIYVCAQGEFGRLEPDASGQMQYVPLMTRHTHPQYDMTEIWDATAADGAVYFRMYGHLIRYRQGEVKAWEASKFDVVYSVRDTAYIRIVDVGLHRVDGDSLVLVRGGDFFAGIKVNTILPLGHDRLLVATRFDGLYAYDGHRVSSLRTSADSYLKSNFVYDGRRLPGGDVALGTIRGGVVVLAPDGTVRRILDRSNFLPADGIACIFASRRGALWVGYRDHGLSRIEIESPFSLYDPSFGWSGKIFSLAFDPDGLLLSTSSGIYRMPKNSKDERFVPILTTSPYYYGFTRIGPDLLTATGAGVFQIHGNRAVPINDLYTREIAALPGDSTMALTALTDGVIRLRRRPNGSWESGERLHGLFEDVKYLIAFPDRTAWIGTDFQGVVRLDFRGNWHNEPSIERFGASAQLPVGRVQLLASPDGPVFLVAGKWYRFDKGLQGFLPLEREVMSQWKGDDLLSLNQSRWIMDPYWLANFTDKPHLNRIWPLKTERQYAYERDEEGVEWFGGDNILVRYDNRLIQNVQRELVTFIRQVVFHGDSTVLDLSSVRVPVSFSDDHSSHQMRIDFTLPVFEEAVEFQWVLEGLDAHWSPWTRTTFKEYVRLPDGPYVFRVRGRDVYGNVASEASIGFRVLPPWYLTWWAFAMYGVIVVGLGYAALRLRLRYLERRNAELEALAVKNSMELKQAQIQLLQSEKMAAVGQMVAGLAHEINNPLTFIMPNLDYIDNQLNKVILYFETTDETERRNLHREIEHSHMLSEIKSAIEPALRGGERIRDIVRNLQVFTHFDEATLSTIDIDQQIDHMHLLFFSNLKDIEIRKELTSGRTIKGQARELNQCFINIVDNAVQAIREAERTGLISRGDGVITLHTENLFDRPGLRIVIRDNGVGMKPEVTSRIFEPFFTTRPVGSGRGLGLSEVYAIISKLKGTITVQSEPTKGTEVEIRLTD